MSATLSSPSELARETIRQLAARKLPPTPDNYTLLYGEISGAGQPRHPAHKALDLFASEYGTHEGAEGRRARELVTALDGGDWNTVSTLLGGIARGNGAAPGPSWPDLIREILKQWERRQSGITQARKRENLEHVLTAFGADADKLHAKLASLLRAWRERSEDASPALAEGGGARAPDALPAAALAAPEQQLLQTARELVAQTLEYCVIARLGHSPALQEDARELAARARAAAGAPELAKLGAAMKQFFLRVELAGEDIGEMQRGLFRLLRLLTDNVAELVSDDRWMKGQVETVQALLSQPLDPNLLRRAEKEFRELVFKQGTRKTSLTQTKTALKDMVSLFVDRLASVSTTTGEFHARMEEYAQRVANTDDLASLGRLVGELLDHTRGVQADVRRSHEELVDARRRVTEYETRIQQLESELEQVSGLVREDALTGVFNRRGLEEAWAVEAARAERQDSPLCVALLDVDKFKLLNDRLGHQAGDEALAHLAKVIRQTLRPSDVVARYGGEEFVLLLPVTPLDEALAVTVRLQRELTRRFFLHNNERVLITFSAGVAQKKQGESSAQVLDRADGALYEAKRAGRNRVLTAE